METNKESENWEDHIVAEVRAIRDSHARKFDYDIGAIFKDLISQQEAHKATGWEYVRLPAKRLEPHNGNGK